jgi:CRP-like cAMP-binding protein
VSLRQKFALARHRDKIGPDAQTGSDMALDRSLISGLPAFAGLTAKELDAILAQARAVRIAKDAEIFSQDEKARHFFLLLSGHVRVVRTTPTGESVIARYINAGELLGIAVALGAPTYPASAIAAVDCVVLAWPNSAWASLAASFPAFAVGVNRLIGSRLQQTQDRVVEMSTQQVEQRIAAAVLRLANQAGRKTSEGIEIDFPVTRQNIAELTGCTLHTVSRTLSAWQTTGIVQGGRQRVVVTDLRALALIAQGEAKA